MGLSFFGTVQFALGKAFDLRPAFFTESPTLQLILTCFLRYIVIVLARSHRLPRSLRTLDDRLSSHS